MKAKSLIVAGISFMFLLMNVPAKAQLQNSPQQQEQNTEVSDEELEKFAALQEEVEAQNQKGQQKMMKAVEEEGLDVQQYNQISQSTQQPNSEANVDEEKMEKFEKAREKVKSLQTETQQKIRNKIEEEGMNIQRYEEIYMAVQQDPDLQNKLEKLKN